MKIWIALAETNSGNEMSYFYSEADAEQYALEFCKARDELKYMITTGYPSCVDYAADIIVDLGGERLEYEDC